MKKFCVLAVLLVLGGLGAFAQTDSHPVTINVVAIAVIDLNDDGNITFNTSAPANPGEDPGPTALAPATDATKRLWYTVCTAAANYRITVARGAVAPPTGTTLAVEATSAEGGSRVVGGVTITAGAQDIVTGIDSIATGRTGGDGTALEYRFWVDTPTALNAGDTAIVTVTYTLTNT